MSDRLDRAWKLRREVHAWIDAHSDASMPDIKRHFEQVNPETVRIVVKRLKQAGFVAQQRCGPVNRYRAVAAFDQPRDAARARLQACGRAACARLAAQNRCRSRRADGTFAPVALPSTTGVRYVHRPGKESAVKSQGGQGALGVWRGGLSSLGGG